MSRIITVRTGWQTLRANAEAPSNNGFSPSGEYLAAGRVKGGRARIEFQNRIGNIEGIGALQFANNINSPDSSAVNLGSTWLGAAGFQNPTAFAAASTTAAGRQAVRVGFITRNSTGTNLATVEARALFELEVYDQFQIVESPWGRFFTTSGTNVFVPTTRWVRAAPYTQLRCMFEMQAEDGDFAASAAYQTADDTANPDTAVAFGTARNAAGIEYPTAYESISTAAGGSQAIRFGWMIKINSGTIGGASLAGEFELTG